RPGPRLGVGLPLGPEEVGEPSFGALELGHGPIDELGRGRDLDPHAQVLPGLVEQLGSRWPKPKQRRDAEPGPGRSRSGAALEAGLITTPSLAFDLDDERVEAALEDRGDPPR